MIRNFLVKLSWQDLKTHERREPTLSLPIALGRNFKSMPVVIQNRRISRIVINDKQVSRYHVLIDSKENDLVITDQGSSNGFFVNGKLKKNSVLANGDILEIGSHKITVTFTSIPLEPNQTDFPIPATFTSKPPKSNLIDFPIPIHFPTSPIHSDSNSLGITKFFPILSHPQNLLQNGFLVPGLITVVFVVAMFGTRKTDEVLFLYLLAIYLASVSHYLVHKLCHKDKPWWLLISLGLATGLPLLSGFHFSIPKTGNYLLDLITKAFLEHGLFQEFFKAFPVLLVYLFSRLLPSSQQKSIGVYEPMDGILLATASATGFALVETMLIVHNELKIGDSFAGLTLVITHILGDIFGQVAYSGYFGYFIGLSALKPSKRFLLLGIGYITSASIHGLAAMATILHKEQQHNLLAGISLAIIGSVAYSFLMAAILKARQLSPHNSQQSNFSH